MNRGASGVVATTTVTIMIKRAVVVCLLALAVAGYFTNLGNAPLTEQSEARYVEVAWEMVTSHDYLTPRYNFIKHFHKPPLYYWSIVASFQCFGISELSARLPSTLAALLCLGLTWWFVRCEMKADSEQAWLAAGFLAATPFFWEMARVSVTDMFVTLFVLLSFTAFWRLLRDPENRRANFLFWLGLGLNFLTKGPVGPLIVLTATLSFCRIRSVPLGTLRIAPGVFLALLVSLPWYVWAVWSNPGLFSYLLKSQTLDRVVSEVHGRSGPWWYYLPVLACGFLPWTPWLLIRIKELVRRRRPDAIELLVGLWVLPPLLFFSIMGSKLPPYILPLFPALAILLSTRVGKLTRNQLRWPGGVFLFCGILMMVQTSQNLLPRLERYNSQLVVAGVLLNFAGLILSVKTFSWRVVAGGAIGAMLALEIVAATAYPQIAYRTAQPVAEAILAEADSDFEVAMYGTYLFGLPYYLNRSVIHVRHARELLFESDDNFKKLVRPTLQSYLEEFRSRDKEHFLIIAQPDWPEVRKYFQEPVFYSNERYLVLHNPGRR